MPDPITRFESYTVVLPGENIDTDQLLPARFMTTTSRHGLGAALLHDARHDALSGEPNDHVLNRIDSGAHRVLVAGRNFGCGSSREHAVWALADYGFQAVLAPRMADIFRANALNNDVLAVEIDDGLYAQLVDQNTPIIVDLERQTIRISDGVEVHFDIAPFARHCLLNGVDRLQYLLSQSHDIVQYERKHFA